MRLFGVRSLRARLLVFLLAAVIVAALIWFAVVAAHD